MRLAHLLRLYTVFISIVAVTACGNGEGKQENEQIEKKQEIIKETVEVSLKENISIYPQAGPPGTPLVIDGLNVPLAAQDQIVVLIGNQIAPLIPANPIRNNGEATFDPAFKAYTAIPAYIAGLDGKALPTDALDVQVFQNDKLLFELNAAITVEALPAAPGTATQIIQQYSALATEINRIAQDFYADDSIEKVYLDAYTSIITDLISSDGQFSLTKALAELENLDPDAYAMLESLMAVSGFDQALAEMLEGFQSFSFIASPSESSLSRATLYSFHASGINADGSIQLDDKTLAERMNAYEQMKTIGDALIHGAAEHAAVWAGLTGGAALLFPGAAPVAAAVGLVNSLLAVIDFMFNKVWLGFYPSTIVALELTSEKDFLQRGETLDTAKFVATAVNQPPGVTINDYVGLILAGLGVASTASGAINSAQNSDKIAATALQGMKLAQEQLAKINKVVENIVLYATTTTQSFITLASSRVDGSIPLDHKIDRDGLVPERKWKATIHNRKYLVLFTTDRHTLLPIEDSIAWMGGAKSGIEKISAMINPIEWNTIARSNTVDITVSGDLSLSADAPDKSGGEPFTITLGAKYATDNGSNIEASSSSFGKPRLSSRTHTSEAGFVAANAIVTIAVEQGTASSEHVTTDANGHAEVTITPNEDADIVSVTFDITDTFNSTPAKLTTETVISNISGTIRMEETGYNAYTFAEFHLSYSSVGATPGGVLNVSKNNPQGTIHSTGPVDGLPNRELTSESIADGELAFGAGNSRSSAAISIGSKAIDNVTRVEFKSIASNSCSTVPPEPTLKESVVVNYCNAGVYSDAYFIFVVTEGTVEYQARYSGSAQPRGAFYLESLTSETVLDLDDPNNSEVLSGTLNPGRYLIGFGHTLVASTERTDQVDSAANAESYEAFFEFIDAAIINDTTPAQ
ncbi:MAG: hypothetical protein OEZ58_03795 [Gammaproteobacteria bacterium]|nr:hypothetical protein [Gammaproteobacteria bacterium]MDH5728087.1 hypothetical protein [Gammaproteobacteria bacterium]